MKDDWKTIFPAAVNESQRDSGPKPKVARHELPWVNGGRNFLNPSGVVVSARFVPAQPRRGWTNFPSQTLGSSCLATPGWRTQSPWDCPQAFSIHALGSLRCLRLLVFN